MQLNLSRTGADRVRVEFRDSRTMREIFGSIKQLVCLYTVEINPPTHDSRVIAVKAGEGRRRRHNNYPLRVEAADLELQAMNGSSNMDDYLVKVAEFTALKPEVEYKIRVSTIINGRAIAKKIEILKPEEATEGCD